MVDLRAPRKLRDRAERIVMAATGVKRRRPGPSRLARGRAKMAVLMHCRIRFARRRALKRSGGLLGRHWCPKPDGRRIAAQKPAGSLYR